MVLWSSRDSLIGGAFCVGFEHSARFPPWNNNTTNHQQGRSLTPHISSHIPYWDLVVISQWPFLCWQTSAPSVPPPPNPHGRPGVLQIRVLRHLFPPIGKNLLLFIRDSQLQRSSFWLYRLYCCLTQAALNCRWDPRLWGLWLCSSHLSVQAITQALGLCWWAHIHHNQPTNRFLQTLVYPRSTRCVCYWTSRTGV